MLWSGGEEHCGAGRGMGCPCHALISIIGSGGDRAGWLQIVTLMKVCISVGTVPSVAMTLEWILGLWSETAGGEERHKRWPRWSLCSYSFRCSDLNCDIQTQKEGQILYWVCGSPGVGMTCEV